MSQELRDKYISKQSEYSYVHKHDIDEILKKLEELEQRVSKLEPVPVSSKL